MKSLPASGCDAALLQQAEQAVQRWQRAEQNNALGAETSQRLRAALTHAAEAARRAPYEPPRPSPSATAHNSSEVISAEFFTTRSESPLGNERDSRRLYLKLADAINQQDAYEPTGYLLRRYGLWSGIHSTPPIKRDARTEMMSVPADITTEYQELLGNNGISPALLLRVEKSVASSPYWLRGSLLSARIAQRLEMPVVAEVIRTAAERFVRRLPVLRDLQFADGVPFVDAETLAWISGAAPMKARRPSSMVEHVRRDEEESSAIDDADIGQILQRLQASQNDNDAPRRRYLSSVSAADALAAHGLHQLSQQLYEDVATRMHHLTAAQWDADIFAYVSTQAGQDEASTAIVNIRALSQTHSGKGETT